MATYSKEILSGSSNGKQVKVVDTSTPGTVIHTAVSGTSSKDEIWLYAVNTSENGVKLTIEWGDSSVDDLIEVVVPPENGYILIIPGLVLQNSLEVRAFAATANVININGFVNRIV